MFTFRWQEVLGKTSRNSREPTTSKRSTLRMKSMHTMLVSSSPSCKPGHGCRSNFTGCCCIANTVGVFLRCSPNYFKRCKISALALLKLVMHARSGGTLEVMGMLLGKIDGENMIVMDSFALPVEGTGRHSFFPARRVSILTPFRNTRQRSARSLRVHEFVHPLGERSQPTGERHRLVPFASWLRLLAFGHRRRHANAEPAIPGPIRRHCGTSSRACPSIVHLPSAVRLIQRERSPRER